MAFEGLQVNVTCILSQMRKLRHTQGQKAGEGLGLSHLKALSLSSPLTVSWGLKCLGAGDTLGKALRQQVTRLRAMFDFFSL